MDSVIVAFVAFLIGVVAVFAAAALDNAARNWRYKRRYKKELKERPDVYAIPYAKWPHKIVVELDPNRDYRDAWEATPFDRDSKEIKPEGGNESWWARSIHPMDAVRDLLLDMQGKQANEIPKRSHDRM